MLISWHNVAYYQHLMAGMRQAIIEAAFAVFAEGFAREYAQGDVEPWSASKSGRCTPLAPTLSRREKEASGAGG
jgi:hypothetical protein